MQSNLEQTATAWQNHWFSGYNLEKGSLDHAIILLLWSRLLPSWNGAWWNVKRRKWTKAGQKRAPLENQSVRNNANIEPHCHDDVRERSKSRSIDKYKMFVFIFSFFRFRIYEKWRIASALEPMAPLEDSWGFCDATGGPGYRYGYRNFFRYGTGFGCSKYTSVFRAGLWLGRNYPSGCSSSHHWRH